MGDLVPLYQSGRKVGVHWYNALPFIFDTLNTIIILCTNISVNSKKYIRISSIIETAKRGEFPLVPSTLVQI